jgi:hypothetical protein
VLVLHEDHVLALGDDELERARVAGAHHHEPGGRPSFIRHRQSRHSRPGDAEDDDGRRDPAESGPGQLVFYCGVHGHRVAGWPVRSPSTRTRATSPIERPSWSRISGIQGRFGHRRPAASIVGGLSSKRTVDKSARLYRASTRGSTAQRAGDLRNSCSTAELCRRRSRIADAQRHQLFAAVQSLSTSCSRGTHSARIADKCEHATGETDLQRLRFGNGRSLEERLCPCSHHVSWDGGETGRQL